MIGGGDVSNVSQVFRRSECRTIYEIETLEEVEYFEKPERHTWSSQVAKRMGLGP